MRRENKSSKTYAKAAIIMAMAAAAAVVVVIMFKSVWVKTKKGITEPVYDYEDAVKLGFTVFKESNGSLTMVPFHIGLLDEYYILVGFRMSDEYKESHSRQAENEECLDNTGNILPDEYGNNQEDNFKDNPSIKSYERILKGTSGD